MIKNKFDKTGMGMFSKTGRFTSEKFYILRKKDEIMNVKHKTLKVPLFTASSQIVIYTLFNFQKQVLSDINRQHNDLPDIEPEPDNLNHTVTKKAPKEAPVPVVVKQPFGKMCSRDYLNKISKDKAIPPPLGCYNPKRLKVSGRIWRVYDNEDRTMSLKAIRAQKEMNRLKMMNNMKKARPNTAHPKLNIDDAKSVDSIDENIDLVSRDSESIARRRKKRAKTAKPKKKGPKKTNFFERFPNRPISGYVSMKSQLKRKPLVTKELFD